MHSLQLSMRFNKDIKQFLLLLIFFTLTACVSQAGQAATPTSSAAAPLVFRSEENPFAPQPSDAGLQQAGVILTSLDLIERTDLDPLRIELNILGSMPSVCSELRIQVSPPDDELNLKVNVYSLSDPKQNCDNVFQQFKANIMLGQYSPGQYSVWVNDLFVGNFTSY